MRHVRQTRQARRSLREIGRYIAEQSGSLTIAEKFLDRIADKAARYAGAPMLGDSRDDLGPNVRCFYVKRYVVLYLPRSDGILILLVIHSARDIPTVFRETFGESHD